MSLEFQSSDLREVLQPRTLYFSVLCILARRREEGDEKSRGLASPIEARDPHAPPGRAETTPPNPHPGVVMQREFARAFPVDSPTSAKMAHPPGTSELVNKIGI